MGPTVCNLGHPSPRAKDNFLTSFLPARARRGGVGMGCEQRNSASRVPVLSLAVLTWCTRRPAERRSGQQEGQGLRDYGGTSWCFGFIVLSSQFQSRSKRFFYFHLRSSTNQPTNQPTLTNQPQPNKKRHPTSEEDTTPQRPTRPSSGPTDRRTREEARWRSPSRRA